MNVVVHGNSEGSARAVTADVVTQILATMPIDFEAVFGSEDGDEAVDQGRVFPGVFDKEVINP